jgi:hypothetical protein
MSTQQFDRSRHVPRNVVIKIESSTRSVWVEDADFNQRGYVADSLEVALQSQKMSFPRIISPKAAGFVYICCESLLLTPAWTCPIPLGIIEQRRLEVSRYEVPSKKLVTTCKGDRLVAPLIELRAGRNRPHRKNQELPVGIPKKLKLI